MILDDDYKIERADDKNVVLYKKRIVKKSKDKTKIGKEEWEAIAYCGNIKHAFKRYCDIQLNGSLDNYMTIINKYDELMKKIDEIKG